MNLIEYKDVNVYQESQLVLQDVNVEIGEGEFVYVTGKVGTGKSSFLKTLYGEILVKEGEAKVMGYDLVELKRRRLPDLRKKLGIIFQDFQLLTDRTVDANLRFVLKATKGYKMPSELSGGEQQRIVIARAILNSPKLILADEPTGNLDAETSRQIVELLRQICKAGSTVVMITHNLNLIEQFPGRQLLCENHQLTDVTLQEPAEDATIDEID